MGNIKCEIQTSPGSDMLTVEVKSKDGKIYQKRSSFLNFQVDGFGAKSPYETAVKALIYVEYGDAITATRGSGTIYLTDTSASDFTGKAHMLAAKPNEVDTREVKEVKVTKENVRTPPHIFSKPDQKAKKVYRQGTSVHDA